MARPKLLAFSAETFDRLAAHFKRYHDSPDGKLAGLQNERTPYEAEVLDIVFGDPSYVPDAPHVQQLAWLAGALEDIAAADEQGRLLSHISCMQRVTSPGGSC